MTRPPDAADPADPASEAGRQHLLLALLRGALPLADAGGAVRAPGVRSTRRGLQAYAAHAGALAERALTAAFPTIAQLVGETSLAALARAFWQAHPPARGDITQWGEALPGFIAADPQLADEPCLADVARLDWAVHQAEQASDSEGSAQGLALLGSDDPDRLWLHLAPGTALVSSPHPVATLWQAHRSSAADRFAPVREALAQRRAEHALVWRQGFPARVTALPAEAAGFTQAVLHGQPLGAALDGAGPDFAFQPWLLAALQQGWLAAVATRAPGRPAERATP